MPLGAMYRKFHYLLTTFRSLCNHLRYPRLIPFVFHKKSLVQIITKEGRSIGQNWTYVTCCSENPLAGDCVDRYSQIINCNHGKIGIKRLMGFPGKLVGMDWNALICHVGILFFLQLLLQTGWLLWSEEWAKKFCHDRPLGWGEDLLWLCF